MTKHSKESIPIRLIVNADDYGYFASVSRGILDAGRTGAITATGVMANCRSFEENVSALCAIDSLDVGVHLNLTFGRPVSKEMSRQLVPWKSAFPGKFAMTVAILTGRIKLAHVVQEWRAQIERCLESGLVLRFLNSHEHIHMLPPLFPQTLELAKYYNIPFVRYATAEWVGDLQRSALGRNVILHLLGSVNFMHKQHDSLRLIGMSHSGKLDLTYLKRRFPSLRRGQIYELMCHPGYYDPEEIKDMRLVDYHHWQRELDLLQSDEMDDLCKQYNMQVIGYRDIIR